MPHPLMLLLLSLGCGRDRDPAASDSVVTATDTEEEEEEEEGTGCGDWSSVGQPLMLSYCTGCHSQSLVGEARHGAPAGVDLETLAGVQAQRARVEARAVVQQDMPQGGGLSAADRERLSAWLACGAPGEEAPLPARTSPDTAALTADDVTVTVSPVGIAERLVRRTRSDGRVLLEERFLVDGGAVLFVGYDLRLEGGGRSLWLEPPLPLTPPRTGETSWTASVQAEVEEGVTETQTWTLTWTEDAVAYADGRSEDRASAQIDAVTDDGAERHRWRVSETHVFSGRALTSSGVSLELLRLDRYVPDLPDEIMPFPPEVGDTWSESAIWGAGAGEGGASWWE